MKAIILTLVLISCFFSSAANAAPMSGNDLHRFCTEKNSPTFKSLCNGYIMGVADGEKMGIALYYIVSGYDKKKNIRLNQVVNAVSGRCNSLGTDYVQYVDVVIQYLQKHPKKRHKSARFLIHTALAGAFSCKR